jgi:hypothetical protein
MKDVRRFLLLGLLAITLLVSLTLAAETGDIAAIQQKLDSQYRLTRATSDLTDIVTAGDVVTIHKSNLVMFSGTAVPATNNYNRGAISQGFGTVLIETNPNTVQRQFVPEEKCWVTGIRVQKDGVLFQLFSDPYNGRRYYSSLKVAFPNKKEVPPVDVVLGLIAEVLTVAPTDDQNAQSWQPPSVPPRGVGTPTRGRGFSSDRPAPVPEEGSNASVPQAASMPDIAPPPLPSDAPPPTIALGQTKEQVTAGFGQPARIAMLGAKEIFF